MLLFSPPTRIMAHAFGLRDHRYIFLIGGGGKTTLLFALAHCLSREGHTVVSTTSTKILYPPAQVSARVLVEDDLARLVSRLKAQLPGSAHMTVGRSLLAAHNKLCGFSAEELDHLRRAGVADYIVVEADGAKGRSLKAHGQHEPVVSAHADLVIAVIGVDCIGKPLNDEYVHRAGRFCKLVNRRMDAPVTIDDVSAIVFHPHGYLKGLQPETEVTVFVSKVKSESDRENAGRLAVALQAADSAGRVRHVVIGELAGPSPWLELQSRSP